MIDLPVDYRPDRALHPGRFLKENLDALGMSQREFARRMGRPPQVINQIIREKKSVTPTTALGFEKVLGIDAQFWLNLQQLYDIVTVRMAEDEQLEREQRHWLKRLPFRNMAELGWIEDEERDSQWLRQLLQFFAVGSFDALSPTTEAIGFRITEKAKVDEWALRAWLRQGERLAGVCETAPYDANRFEAAVRDIRGLTSESPEDFWPRMQRLCADAGVSVVAVPHLPKTGANGVARWLNPRKAMIQLNLRYAWADIFWFTFFHEAAHVLQYQTKRVFVDLPSGDRKTPEEADANRFACDTLIPPEQFRHFSRRERFASDEVKQFAAELDIHPGIVVGRLKREELAPGNRLDDLRVPLTIATTADTNQPLEEVAKP